LRGIHNYASFLKEDHAAQLGEAGRQHIDSIQRLAERLSTLVDSLMIYSRLGASELVKDTVDVDAVVDAVAEDMNRLWEKGGIALRRNGRLGTVQGDALRIGEVFQNLFSNAAKYNDKPSKWIEVGRVHSSIPPVFYVRDNGIGISPQHHDNVFRTDHRQKNRRTLRRAHLAGICPRRGDGVLFYFER
jgi:light-regulated signal transduction histidine kinase (bacteriophytochrome)